MNKYGAQAMRHWQQTDPDRYAAIPDKEAFFTELGEQTEQQIETLAATIAGPDRPRESYLEKVGRLNMARFTAESDLLREMVLIRDPDDPEIDERPAQDPMARGARAIQQLMWDEDLSQDEEEDQAEPANG
jgi:hypothetical protein